MSFKKMKSSGLYQIEAMSFKFVVDMFGFKTMPLGHFVEDTFLSQAKSKKTRKGKK